MPASLPASELVLLLSASAVALIQHHALVADTLTVQGYVPRLLALLTARLPSPPSGQPEQLQQLAATKAAGVAGGQQQRVVDEGGALLRLLHALAASAAACEAVATAGGSAAAAGAVAALAGASAWGAGAEVLVLETLKRALGQGNRNRDLLVGQALQVRSVGPCTAGGSGAAV